MVNKTVWEWRNLKSLWNSLIFFDEEHNRLFAGIIRLWLVNAGKSRDTQGHAGTNRDKAGTSRDKAGTNRDKQGPTGTFPACPCLSLLVLAGPCLSLLVPTWPWLSLSVHACPCLSLSVPVCSCLSLIVSLCLFICYTLMSTPADEYNSLHQYEHSYIDFPCKRHCSNACKLFFFFFFFILLS